MDGLDNGRVVVQGGAVGSSEWCRDCRWLCNFVGTNYLQMHQTNMVVGGRGVVVDYVMDLQRGKLPLPMALNF